MMPGEIKKLTVDLCRREGHQFAGGFDRKLGEGPMQSHRRILKDIVGVVPAADVGKPDKHPMGQRPQPIGAESDDLVAGVEVAGGEAIEAGGEGRSELMAFHGAVSAEGGFSVNGRG